MRLKTLLPVAALKQYNLVSPHPFLALSWNAILQIGMYEEGSPQARQSHSLHY